MTLSRNLLMIHSDNEIKWLLQVKPYPIIPIYSDVFYANSLKFRSFINENENTLRNGLLVRARKCQDTNSLTCKFFEYLPLMALIIVRDKSADYSSRTHITYTRGTICQMSGIKYSRIPTKQARNISFTQEQKTKSPIRHYHSRLGVFPFPVCDPDH